MPLQKLEIAPEAADRALVPLSSIEVVYADSRTALEAAWDLGLARSAEIRTSSPHLLMDPDLGAAASDRDFTPERLQRLRDEISAWAIALYENLIEDPALTDLALVAARRASRFQTQIFKIMALREEDFQRPVAVITFDVADPVERRLLTPPIARVLKSAPGYREIRFPEGVQIFERPLIPPPASFRDRFRTATWAAKAYRTATKIWDKLPNRSPRGTILIHSENPLIKETAYEFAKRGYGLRQLTPPTATADEGRSEAAAAMVERLASKITAQFEHWLVPAAVAPTAEYLMSDIDESVSDFEGSLGYWRRQLADLQSVRPRMVMLNLVHSPEASGLCVAARERGLLVAGFQHGVSREIGLVGDRDELWYQTISADIFFTHTQEAARITNASKLTRGAAVAVGLENGFRRVDRLKPARLDAPPIWYISGLLHIGNIQPLYAGVRDLDQTEFELRIMDRVLARLPHRVLHKPYPFGRYPDSDPVNDRARRAPNIEIHDDLRDLRYLLADSKVLVTWGASSTMGLCVMSGKPVVNIVHPARPFSPRAHAALTDGIFVFESDTPDFFDNLRRFLSKPIEEIEAEWRARSEARGAIVKEFFDCGGGRAGRRAARLLQRSGFDAARISG